MPLAQFDPLDDGRDLEIKQQPHYLCGVAMGSDRIANSGNADPQRQIELRQQAYMARKRARQVVNRV
jgi:hypothetical protein